MTDTYALGTFASDSEASWPGVIRNRQVAKLGDLLSEAPDELLAVLQDWPKWDPLIAEAVANGPAHVWRSETELSTLLPIKPENLLGAGANYRRHVIEILVDRAFGSTTNMTPEEKAAFGAKTMDERAANGKPFVWIGLRGAISSPSDPLVVPFDMTEVDWELELAVVMGRRARRVSRDKALEYVAGYTIANDITARELVERPDAGPLGMDWMACKSAPGFHILGPYITPARFVPDPQALHIRLTLNGDVMQDEGTDDMIFNVAQIIEFVSAHIELQPGDVIMTGSPAGNGTHYNRFLRDGDLMVGTIKGIVGQQNVQCVAESAQPA